MCHGGTFLSMHEERRQGMPIPKTWLIVERIENWTVDKESNFDKFGFSSRLERRASQIEKGDTLIVYVSSGISSFSDIRRVTSEKLQKLKYGGDYDSAFPVCVQTESVFDLPRASWVPIKELVSTLSFTKNKADWRQVMRNSLRILEHSDAEIIMSRMKGALKDAA